mgnify:CR=1 FL=1
MQRPPNVPTGGECSGWRAMPEGQRVDAALGEAGGRRRRGRPQTGTALGPVQGDPFPPLAALGDGVVGRVVTRQDRFFHSGDDGVHDGEGGKLALTVGDHVGRGHECGRAGAAAASAARLPSQSESRKPSASTMSASMWDGIQVTTRSVRWTRRHRSPLMPSVQLWGIGWLRRSSNLCWR